MTPTLPYPMPWLPPLAVQIEAFAAQVAREGVAPLPPGTKQPRVVRRARHKRRADVGRLHPGSMAHKLLAMIRRRPGVTSRELREEMGVDSRQWKRQSTALSELLANGVLRAVGTDRRRQYYEVKR